MLVELVVENFAVVEKLRLRFHAGFNVLTGETGSGKSLVVDALSLLLGGRASADLIRSGETRAMISGIFEVPHRALPVLANAGIELEDGELLIEREVLSSGKSRAFAGGRTVTAAFLRDLGEHLGDIHGQHDQQRLFNSDAQRQLLDAAAGLSLTQLSSLYREWRAVLADLDELDRLEQEKLRLVDLWTMQRKEIDALGLRPGEDAVLQQESVVLKNVTRLSESAEAAFQALSDAPESAASNLRIALKRLEELARIDATMRPLLDNLRPAQIAVDEAALELRRYLGHLEADPARLEEVETRLAGIERLKRKYGNTIDDILAFLTQVQENLNLVENAGERRDALKAQAQALEAGYRAEAGRVTAQRRKAAKVLEKAVEKELAGLAMAGSAFRIALSESPPAEHGMDAVDLLISANLGEEPRPLDRVASGGELSRVALALKTCVVSQELNRTLVFDEVDAGVGGTAAEMVGRRLKQIAGNAQVLCVTHLAQIAGFADHHYLVSKRESGQRTVSEVTELAPDARTREVARMLSGSHLSDEALKHAGQLIADYGRRGK